MTTYTYNGRTYTMDADGRLVAEHVIGSMNGDWYGYGDYPEFDFVTPPGWVVDSVDVEEWGKNDWRKSYEGEFTIRFRPLNRGGWRLVRAA